MGELHCGQVGVPTPGAVEPCARTGSGVTGDRIIW
jgi:hypothetical protein